MRSVSRTAAAAVRASVPATVAYSPGRLVSSSGRVVALSASSAARCRPAASSSNPSSTGRMRPASTSAVARFDVLAAGRRQPGMIAHQLTGQPVPEPGGGRVPGPEAEHDRHGAATIAGPQQVEDEPRGQHRLARARAAEHDQPPGRDPPVDVGDLGQAAGQVQRFRRTRPARPGRCSPSGPSRRRAPAASGPAAGTGPGSAAAPLPCPGPRGPRARDRRWPPPACARTPTPAGLR